VTFVIAKLSFGAALLAAACSPALAQMSVSKGQVLTIGQDGQVTSGAMPTDAKMMKMMHHMGKPMKGPLMVWMDDKGHMMVCSCGENGRGDY
jgi:hypothetical protein